MDLPRLLLLGPRGMGKRALASQITGRPAAPNQACCHWEVDTKYYTAQVLVEVQHLEDVSSTSQSEWGGYEAVVLVFSSHAGFAQLREWWGAAGGAGGFEVKLALATSCGPPRPAWLAEAGEWCLSELVELVEEAGAEGEEDGAGGAAGVERLKEALHAHMWSGLALKPREREQLGSGAPSSEDAAAGPVHDLEASELSSRDRAAAAGLLPEHEEDDELGRLFADISTSKNRLARLGDEERRDAAAAMVFKLMQSLGVDSGSEEGSEGEDDDAGRAAALAAAG